MLGPIADEGIKLLGKIFGENNLNANISDVKSPNPFVVFCRNHIDFLHYKQTLLNGLFLVFIWLETYIFLFQSIVLVFLTKIAIYYQKGVNVSYKAFIQKLR